MASTPAVEVAFHIRCPAPFRFSIERVFDAVGRHLPAPYVAVQHRCPCVGRGIVDRVYNGLAARRAGGVLHHVTGDVHYLACFLPRGRTVLTIHDCVTLKQLAGLKRAVARLFWYWLPVRCASIVTTISEFSRQEVLQATGCDPAKVRVVHDPLPNGFTPVPRQTGRERPVILQVGAAAHKNVARVAEAVAPLRCTLWIVGHLDQRTAHLISELKLDHAVFSGISDEQLRDLYRQCDVVVAASTYEGFGLPIIEAQATGRAVVTSNLCSMPEVAGNAALLVDPFDVGSIRSAVARVLGDFALYDSLVAKGLQNVARFQPEAIAASYAQAYRELTSFCSH